MSIRLETLIHDETSDCYLCFRHAVAAAQAGHEIKLETDKESDGDEYGLRHTSCSVCDTISEAVEKETEKKALEILKALCPGEKVG
jgi:glutamine synthetase